MKNFPSISESLPNDFGGIYARNGFAYQDDVAAGYYIEMLKNNELLEVSCETHDDICLVWNIEKEHFVEFIQVKAEHPDQLWSVAKLCERKKSAENTSIFEKSLSRDQYSESSRFRLVTCRQIHSDLKLLTRELGHEYRSLSYSPFVKLERNIKLKVGDHKSKKGNDIEFWLKNAKWEVISEDEICILNMHALGVELYNLGLDSDPDTIRTVYDGLRTLAKDTAEYTVEKWKEKTIKRDDLINKIKSLINPYPEKGKVEKLESKMIEAGLDSICISVAKDQQRRYLSKRRSSPYLNTERVEDIEYKVLDTLHGLRASLDSGEFRDNGTQFHKRCLKEVTNLRLDDVQELPSGYSSGCMYEIAARCRHRFKRIKS